MYGEETLGLVGTGETVTVAVVVAAVFKLVVEGRHAKNILSSEAAFPPSGASTLTISPRRASLNNHNLRRTTLHCIPKSSECHKTSPSRCIATLCRVAGGCAWYLRNPGVTSRRLLLTASPSSSRLFPQSCTITCHTPKPQPP